MSNVEGMTSSEFEEPTLGSPMEFLKDPDSRQKLSKVKRELERTSIKIQRKRSDQKSLTIFTAAIGVLISVLLLNISEFALIFAISATLLFLALSFYLYKKVYHPLDRDLSHLNTKMNYLQNKLAEVSNALSGRNRESSHRHSSRKHSRKREVTDF